MVQIKSPIPLVLFFINLIPLFYLSSRGVESANFYFLLALMFPAITFLIWWFLGGTMGELFPRLPIKEKAFQSSQLFFLGAIIPVGLSLIGVITSKVMSPFFLFSQTFYQAYVIGESRFLEWFLIGFSAGIMEELIFTISFVMAGMLIGYWLRLAWGFEFGKAGNYYFHVAIGSLFSVIPFVIFHSLNPSYSSWQLFLVAGIFKIVMNFLVWTIFGISFSIGFHIMNNTLTLSSSVLIGAFTSAYGLIILLVFASMLWNAMRHWREMDTTFSLGDIWGEGSK